MLVSLRSFTMEDVPAVTRLLGAGPEISVRTATIPFPYTEDDARAFITRVRETGERAYAIVRTSDEALIGGAGIIGSGEQVEVGYWIGVPYWGQGYATAALARLIELASASGCRELTAWVFPDNPASARVLLKNGFTCEGEFDRDLPLRGGIRRLLRFRLHIP